MRITEDRLTPMPSGDLSGLGLHDDVAHRIEREIHDQYVRRISTACLMAAVALPLFALSEVARQTWRADVFFDFRVVAGARFGMAGVLAGMGLWLRSPIVPPWLPRIFDITAHVGIGLTQGLLAARDPEVSIVHLSSLYAIVYVRCLYVPGDWRMALVGGLSGWMAGMAGLTIAWPDPSGWLAHATMGSVIAGHQFTIAVHVGLAVAGSRLIGKVREREIETRSRARYRIQARIGRGGFGQVFRAWDNLLDRACAIKRLDTTVGHNPEMLRRFELEARATSKLKGPNTISVYDFGATLDGELYYVMELLDGRDLARIIAEEAPLPLDRTVRLAAAAARGLAEAHHAGVVHRDVKPANLFVSGQGHEEHLKVVDFGLAAIITDGGARLTSEGLTGTPAFASPERIRGDRGGPATDIYSLGGVIFEALTGRLPFTAESSMGLLFKHLEEAPVAPSTYRPEVPPALDDLVLQCLAKVPSDRPVDMRVVVAALESIGETLDAT